MASTKKRFPRLLKTLAKLFGARRAKQKVIELSNNKHLDLLDSDNIACAFVWSESEQGHFYWAKLNRKLINKEKNPWLNF